MKTEYIDYVLCKHPNSSKTYVFKAPWTAYIKVGERLLVDTQYGEQIAEAVAVRHMMTVDSEEEKFFKACFGDREIKSVIGRIYEIKYEEDDDE